MGTAQPRLDDTTRTLIFDDGSSVARRCLERARPVSAEVVLVCAAGSTNRAAMVAEIDSWHVPLTVHDLEPRQGIRHALQHCSDEAVMIAFVPDPGDHRGVLVRKCLQVVAEASHFQLPALAVHVVRDAPYEEGPVAIVAEPARDDGFADLLGVALAATVRTSVCRVSVGADVPGSLVEHEARALAREASEAIARGLVPSLPARRVPEGEVDALAAALDGARAAVVGFGGFDTGGHKWSAPDELPDSVLETELGRLVHHLVDRTPCDLVVVIDAVRLRRGAAVGVVLGLVAAAVLSGAVMSGNGDRSIASDPAPPAVVVVDPSPGDVDHGLAVTLEHDDATTAATAGSDEPGRVEVTEASAAEIVQPRRSEHGSGAGEPGSIGRRAAPIRTGARRAAGPAPPDPDSDPAAGPEPGSTGRRPARQAHTPTPERAGHGDVAGLAVLGHAVASVAEGNREAGR